MQHTDMQGIMIARGKDVPQVNDYPRVSHFHDTWWQSCSVDAVAPQPPSFTNLTVAEGVKLWN